ncbi:MAG: hypothetical protein JSS32_10810 [Verrucomicrobia bacterium]|nr:hypothetical protein [Verrucomicrobiota bacterium]
MAYFDRSFFPNIQTSTNFVEWTAARGSLPGELEFDNIFGLLEMGTGLLIGMVSGWTGFGAVAGGALFSMGLARVTDCEINNYKQKYGYGTTNQYPQPLK